MIYRVTGTIASSIRLHDEESHALPALQPGRLIGVPAGFAIFRDNPVPLPRAYAGRHLDVQHWTWMPRGGHFGVWKEPALFAGDLQAFFRPLRSPRGGR